MTQVSFVTPITLPSEYGTGKDGSITITSGTVNIEDIYENDVVLGVTTGNGVGRGLNYGAGTYDPENGAYINATEVTVNLGATLTHSTAWGYGTDNKNGIGWLACTGKVLNRGTITLDSKGARGGTGSSPGYNGQDGSGSGYGHGGPLYQISTPYGTLSYSFGGGGAGNKDVGETYIWSGYTCGIGGIAYGETTIPATTWANLYGSGGGGGAGGGGHGKGGNGGNGGGALRIYALSIDTTEGVISCNGAKGGDAGSRDAGGGGGSGGTIYLQAYSSSSIGVDKITCSKGIKGYGDNSWNGGDGSVGRIHIEGYYTGSTSDPVIA